MLLEGHHPQPGQKPTDGGAHFFYLKEISQ